MEKIIMISGKAESGKDTVANIAKEYFNKRGDGAIIFKFGDILKIIATNYYKWNGKKDEVGRQLLQEISNNVKSKIDSYFFADTLCNIIASMDIKEKFVILADTRYLEEIEMVECTFPDAEIIKIRIERPFHKSSLTELQLNHDSENSLDEYEYFDFKIIEDDINLKIKKFINILEVL